MILDAKFFVFILFNALSTCFLSSVSVGFIFKAFLYSFIWLFIIYYAISFIKNRFIAESLKSFILFLGIVFSCIDIFGSYYFQLLNADGTIEYIALAKGAYYFWRNISSLRESNNSSQALENASYPKDYLVKNTGNIDNVVLIFGESLNRNFMGVYGYQTPTTPYLSDLKEKGSLLVFDNVISPAFYTDKSFTMLLTYANRDNLNQKAWYQYKNLTHILKLSDYKSI
ncbi:hypothetical protein VN0408_04890 [Helicobacter pylori]